MTRKPVSIKEELGYLEKNSRPLAYFVEAQQFFNQLTLQLTERLEVEVAMELTKEAEEFLKQEGRWFLKPLLMPNQKEISQHAAELAQALLSGWFSILCDEIKEGGLVACKILINEDWFQKNHASLSEGLNVFVLLPDKALQIFTLFILSLHDQTKLTPEMVMKETSEKHVLFIPYQKPVVL